LTSGIDQPGNQPWICIYPGKTALVTGASGCGRAIAAALAREGVAVAVAAPRLDSPKKLAGEIKAGGYIEPVALAADLHDLETPKRKRD
jgi:NAD(P)-dependent dehydrogenase (short-subunit alcohol dehydrogenase family)